MLTVIRNGVSHRFDSGGVRVFQRGDRVVLITSKEGPHVPQNKVRTTADARHPRVEPAADRHVDNEWVD